MSILDTLPEEILVDILSRLVILEKTRFRLTSRRGDRLVTPLCDEVSFHFQRGGCRALTYVANSPKFRPHIRTIHLQVPEELKRFKYFDTWESAIVHECKSPLPEDSNLMSESDWLNLPDSQRRQLYDEYEDESNTAHTFSASLVVAACPKLVPELPEWPRHEYPESSDAISDAVQLLSSFEASLHALENLQSFEYTPTFHEKRRTWRNIKLVNTYISKGPGKKEVFQLFLALRIALSAPSKIQSVKLFTSGNAFWGPSHLHRLIEDLGLPHSFSPYHEQELMQFNGAFSGVKRLACRIDTYETDGNFIILVAKALSGCLQEVKQLERLELVFRANTMSDRKFFTFFTTEFLPREGVDTIQDHPIHQENARLLEETLEYEPFRESYLLAFGYLLLNLSPATENICWLSLSVEVTVVGRLVPFLTSLKQLRHLRLDNVALIQTGDRWETVFEEMMREMQLNSIELFALEDKVQQKPRLLLHPGAPAWSTHGREGTSYYNEYAEAIFAFVLRKSTRRPLLSPEEFLNERSGNVVVLNPNYED